MDIRFEPGEMAMITGAFSVTENIGRVVELVQYIPPMHEAFYQDGFFEGGRTGIWIVRGDSLARNAEGGVVISNLAGIAPQHLAEPQAAEAARNEARARVGRVLRMFAAAHRLTARGLLVTSRKVARCDA